MLEGDFVLVYLLQEPVLERVVFEDVPANLTAIKQHVERLKFKQHVDALEARGIPESFAIANAGRNTKLCFSACTPCAQVKCRSCIEHMWASASAASDLI